MSNYLPLTAPPNCLLCAQFIQVGKLVVHRGMIPLSELYRTCFPSKSYTSYSARSTVLRHLPLACVRIGSIECGTSSVLVMKYNSGMDFGVIQRYFSSQPSQASVQSMTKKELKRILTFAQSRREKETIMYTAIKASGLSLTAARKRFGFKNLPSRMDAVDQAIHKAESICLAIDDLSRCRERAILQAHGILMEDSDSSFDSDSEDSTEVTEEHFPSLPSTAELVSSFQEAKCNWFDFVERIPFPETPQLSMYLRGLLSPCLNEKETRMLEQSYNAYVDFVQELKEREVDALNGLIVPDAAEIDADKLADVSDVTSSMVRDIIIQQRRSIDRHNRYLKAKKLSESNFLSKKKSDRQSTIVNQYPDIGNVIEKFVEDHNVGADHWRRTGVLTFDGNTKVGKKVTFSNIQAHLQEVYKRKFSYGTVVQLCVARNRRRRSAANYRGVAKVTCRRA